MVKINKSKRKSDESDNYNDFTKDLIKFYRISIKTENQMNKMSKKERKQYECRCKRWMSLLETHIQFEVYNALNFFQTFDKMFKQISKRAQELRADPKYEELHKEMVETSELEAKKYVKHLEEQKKAFEDIYIPYKKQREEKMLEIKEEEEKEEEKDMDSLSDTDIDIKEEYISEEDDDEDDDMSIKEEYISEEEIKEEYISEEDYFSAKEEDIDDKKRFKKEMKSEKDVKPFIDVKIKSESEIKSESKPYIKKEYFSSDEESK